MKDILFRLPEIYRAAEERYNEIKETGGGDVFRTVETVAGGGENCLVRGDNLRYMAELLRSGYAGKIDMIYADPPFSASPTTPST